MVSLMNAMVPLWSTIQLIISGMTVSIQFCLRGNNRGEVFSSNPNIKEKYHLKNASPLLQKGKYFLDIKLIMDIILYYM